MRHLKDREVPDWVRGRHCQRHRFKTGVRRILVIHQAGNLRHYKDQVFVVWAYDVERRGDFVWSNGEARPEEGDSSWSIATDGVDDLADVDRHELPTAIL